MSDEDADAIVRMVALGDPTCETQMGQIVCVFCNGNVEGPRLVSRDPVEWAPHDVGNHEDDCAWRLAVEYLRGPARNEDGL